MHIYIHTHIQMYMRTRKHIFACINAVYPAIFMFARACVST